MANSVTVSAVPFNPNTQTFGSTPTQQYNPYSMGSVNLNTGTSAPATQTTQVTPIKPATIPQSQPITTLSTQPVQLPKQQPTQQYSPSINYPASAMQSIATPVQDTANSISSTMLQLIPQLSGQSQELQTQLANKNVPQLQQQYQDLSNQILQRNAELNQADVSLAQGLQNVQDQAIPMQFITGQQASLQNQTQLARAVKISNINMLNATAQATQGNIALAQQTAQQAVDLKYAPIKDMYNTLQAQLTAIQPMLSQEEKRVANQQQAMYDMQKQLLTGQQNQESKFMDMLMKAPTDFGATPDQIGRAISIYNQTGDPIQAFAGVTGADQYINSYQTQNAIRNATYNGVGQLTVDNGYDLNAFKKGIAGVESSNNYNAIGPATFTGDRAYGKYQVMGANIPSWTEEAGLDRMTAQQFLKSPTAQEKVFEYQATKNLARYGNWDDVASVWFSGKPLANNNATDTYNTVPQYVAKVRANMGVPTQPTILSTVTNPSAQLWGQEYIKNQDISKIPKQFQTMALAYANQNVDNTPKIQALTTTINNIDSILTDPNLSGNVGPGGNTLLSVFTRFNLGGIGGGNQNFISAVQQLTNKATIDNLINIKSQGGTFGALSEQELNLLKESATKINTWALKDKNGNVTGYNIDEGNFMKELNQLKTLAQKGILQAGGNILGAPIGQVYATSIIQGIPYNTNSNYGFQ